MEKRGIVLVLLTLIFVLAISSFASAGFSVTVTGNAVATSCPAGYILCNNECHVTYETCSVSNGAGSHYGYCSNNIWNWYVCTANLCNSGYYIDGDGNGCVSASSATSVQCYDTDKGIDFFSRGTISSKNPVTLEWMNETDNCYDMTIVNNTNIGKTTSCAAGVNCAIYEYYCQVINGKLTSGLRLDPCPNGCSNGACIPVQTCTSTCTSLGYQCGAHTICGQNVNCGNCANGYICSNGACINEPPVVKCKDTQIITEETTMTIFGKTISIEYMDSTRVKMNILGEITSSLYEGDNEELYDGSIIKINDIYFPNTATGIGTVNFTIALSRCNLTCEDTDGIYSLEDSYYIKGILVDVVNNKPFTDTCIKQAGGSPTTDGPYVVEGTCTENSYTFKMYACPNGCSNGVCKTATNTTTYYPSPFVVNGVASVAIIYGTQTGVSSLELVQAGNIMSNLQEKYGLLGDALVKDSQVSSVSTKNWIVVGTPCSNSAIYKSLGLTDCSSVASKLGIGPGQAVFKTVANPQGTGIVFLVVGYTPEILTKAVTYLLSKEVRTSVGSSYVITLTTQNQTIYIGQNCTDTDGGKNYYFRGSASHVNPEIDGTIDCCKAESTTNLGDVVAHTGPGGGPCLNEGKYLYEAYCGSNEIPQFLVYQCPNGCSNGACINSTPAECSSNLDCPLLSLPSESYRECDSGKSCQVSGGYNCIGGKCVLSKSYSNCQFCPYGCIDGACLEPNEVNNTYSSCNVNADCYSGYICDGGMCIKDQQGGPSSDQLSCMNAGGTWKTFSNGCADYCEFARRNTGNIACTQVITESCDCGADKCWTGKTCEPNNVTKEITCNYGCSLNSKCYPFGYRKTGKYCSEDYKFVEQTKSDTSCENSFECKSNLCLDDQCVSQGVMKKFFNWLRSRGNRGK
jgi:hypothetical protein